jgi:hypothetical protein
MNVLTKLSDLAAQIAGATQSVQANIAELRRQIAEKRAELRRVVSAPPPKADVKALRVQEIRAATAAYLAEDPTRFVRGLSFTPRQEIGWYQLCALAGPILEERVCAAIDLAEYVPGPPLADKGKVIAGLERELAELEAAEERAIDEATAAGVPIAHRTEVVQRRAQRADKERLDAEWVAAARQRQERVNQIAAQRVTVGRSEYLERITHRDRL